MWRRSSPRTRPSDQISMALVYSLAPKRSSGARYLGLKDDVARGGVPDCYDLGCHGSCCDFSGHAKVRCH